MPLDPLRSALADAPAARDLRAWAADAVSDDAASAPKAGDAAAAHGPALRVQGASGSLPALLLHHLRGARPAPPLVVLAPDEDAAAYLESDLTQLAGDARGLVRFPATGQTPYDAGQMADAAPLIARGDVLQQLAGGFRGVLVTSAEALADRVPPAGAVQQETQGVALGDVIAPTDLIERLVDQGFERVEFVEEPGELALRGGILDVFPFAGEYPIRLEFFGDEIDSIREFDPHTQRSVTRLKTARLVPNLERERGGAYVPLFDYLPDDAVVAVFDEARVVGAVGERYAEAVRRYDARLSAADDDAGEDDAALALTAPHRRYLTGDLVRDLLRPRPRLFFGTFTETRGTNGQALATLALDGVPQPSFNSNLDLLRERIRANADAGLKTFILCDSHGQASRLRDLLEVDIDHGRARLLVETLHEGFELASVGLAVYTDHQIFNRYHRPSTKRQKKYQGGLSLRDLQNLTPGDFVVHVDYGIGRFAGMKKIEVRGKQQEAVKLDFAGGDVLYVNVNALYKLNKYTGKEGHQPSLTKLGSGQWERTKQRTKKKVKAVARDLVKLYAKRKASNGYAFSSDTIWQREMEAAFAFEDTPDQATAARDVKDDMEEPVPMDRLVCGDVGFGKTEVAVRAAFKAAQDGKQVAVLTPTTILAQQHYETFRRRLQRFPVEVDVLSRFRTKAEQADILARLAAGQIDILVGTHRLTSKDVAFHDLGLLVVDEEQRFGVKTKERLRKLRASVDTLTLTATPIPRTLQFSLLGARDLSIIATPPPNRQPIVTEIHTFDHDLIRDAVLYEKNRGGQVFFIHNRVKSINEIAERVRAIVPGARAKVAHGQMSGSELEKVMVDFIEHRFDVLVSTTIIENGLDIANANTMILNRADRLGLSAMHQLRGRVGRSERKAFCYLMVPSVQTLTKAAQQRLRAIEEFSDLGSGFSLAMRDLDIRGAGTLLGAEQSGFISDVGYETYHKILNEAVQELRQEEFSDVFEGEPAPPVTDTAVDVEEDAYIPGAYLENNVERLNLYRRISDAPDRATLAAIREEMADRFGPVPEEVEHLFTGAELRLEAQRLRLPKAQFKNERLFLYLPNEDADPYFYERVFQPLLAALAGLDRRYVLKDEHDRKLLRAIVQDVPTLDAALAVLCALQPEEEVEAEAAAEGEAVEA